MQVIETPNGAKLSVSVVADVTPFIGEDGRDAARQTVEVTIWEHVNTNRKYRQLVPVGRGYSFCQQGDEFDFALGARQATTRALDSIGLRSNINPVVKAVHRLVKAYVAQTE